MLMKSQISQRSKDERTSSEQAQVVRQATKLTGPNSSCMKTQSSKTQGKKYIYYLTDKEEKPNVQMSYSNVDKPDEKLNHEP